jgi:hypothetical protein
MSWLFVLFQIISALPAIIKFVREILDLIKQLPKAQRFAARQELKTIVGDLKLGDKFDDAHAARLAAFRQKLRSRIKP